MTRMQLFDKIREKQSMLCVGLDPDLDKIPRHLLKLDDPIFEFNKAIIDATLPYAVAYKPNVAFYEALGPKGWESLQKTVEYLPKEVFKIADAKRGDIGNTAKKYAETFFKKMNFDSITLSPYMGEDSITPFLEYDNKWVIILGATSNLGFLDFQDILVDSDSEKLYERVIRKCAEWGSKQNTMFVIGATRADKMIAIRSLIPEHFLLIPGVGAQGGNLEQVCKFGINAQGGLLINATRSIIYASDGKDFASKAEHEAKLLQQQMAGELNRHKEFNR
ncbi:pyrF [Symbiodinium microadriaticum]|nr:pyrF [Symbiodinium microadriaticum]